MLVFHNASIFFILRSFILRRAIKRLDKLHLEKISSKISSIVSDIDGVLTNGEITYSSSGTEFKSFNVKDGYSIRRLQDSGIDIALISGRESITNQIRAKELGISHLYQNISDKGKALDTLIEKGFPSKNICAIGDDVQDLALFRHACVTLKITVSDGHPKLIEQADFVTKRKGGQGIMLEVCELLQRGQR